MNELTKLPARTFAPAVPSDRPGSMMHWLRNEMDRFFDDFGPSRSVFNFGGDGALSPAIEFSEGEKEYSITAELPGIDENAIDLSVADGVLTISGEKKEEQERKDKGLYLSERRYGSFRRQFALPADADEGKISAKFKKGVLSIAVPKSETAQQRARKIEIQG